MRKGCRDKRKTEEIPIGPFTFGPGNPLPSGPGSPSCPGNPGSPCRSA